MILGANLMVNIVTDREYKRAQKNLLEHAREGLRSGDQLFIDFDCPARPGSLGAPGSERVCLEGEDDCGTRGRYIVVNDSVSERTRIVRGSVAMKLLRPQGSRLPIASRAISTLCCWRNCAAGCNRLASRRIPRGTPLMERIGAR